MNRKLNILYFSVRGPHFRQGPTYSIPAQIQAQANYDNVLWFNLRDSNDPALKELFAQVSWKQLPYYKDLSDFPDPSLDVLPAPFNKPDLIIFEQFYLFGKYISYIRPIIKSKIPYIIVPRSELTHNAQRQRFLKKKIANLFFFSRFARKAVAIEYLTQQEKQTAGRRWNKTAIVIPNGFTVPTLSPRAYLPSKPLKLVYIGRLSIFHKGLDLLLQACALVKQSLVQGRVSVDIYGPNWQDCHVPLQNAIQELNLQDIVSLHDFVIKEDKIKVLQEADGFIMTSRFEGHPMGLIEALAYGLPCVVTTGTNMREEIEKYNAGWVADNNVKSIASALTQMLAEREQFAQKSAHARALAAQYDWDKIAQDSHEIYCKLIGDVHEKIV